MGVDHLVADLGSLFLTAEDARSVHEGEVLRDVLLGGVEFVGEFLHSCALALEAVDQLEAKRLREQMEPLSKEFNDRVG